MREPLRFAKRMPRWESALDTLVAHLVSTTPSVTPSPLSTTSERAIWAGGRRRSQFKNSYLCLSLSHPRRTTGRHPSVSSEDRFDENHFDRNRAIGFKRKSFRSHPRSTTGSAMTIQRASSHTHTLPHTPSHTLSLSLPLSHTHILSHTLTHTHTHSRPVQDHGVGDDYSEGLRVIDHHLLASVVAAVKVREREISP